MGCRLNLGARSGRGGHCRGGRLTRDRQLGRKLQIDRHQTAGDIQTCLALDADGL
jgi:hypothetical protein